MASPDVCLGGPAAVQRVSTTAHACNGLIHSLHEAYSRLKELREDLPSVSISKSADDDILSLATSLAPVAEQLKVVDGLKPSDNGLFLDARTGKESAF